MWFWGGDERKVMGCCKKKKKTKRTFGCGREQVITLSEGGCFGKAVPGK